MTFANPRAPMTMALPQLALIRVRGADAETFLQGQLSNDVRALSGSRAQIASFNSPKGRVLAVLHVSRAPDGDYFLEMHRGVLEATLKRLRMYVLRAKVTLEEETSLAVIGLAGPGSDKLLQAAGFAVPNQPFGLSRNDGVTVMRRWGATPRFTIYAPRAHKSVGWVSDALAARSEFVWNEFTRAQRGQRPRPRDGPRNPPNADTWRLLDILAGVPTVYPETADHFVPQMANLDQLGGLSFDKGCYTGQEIVARLHYRGEVKRRLYVLRCDAAEALPATPVYRAAGGQPVGEVADAALHPEGGLAIAAVLQIAHAEADDLRLGSAEGAALSRPETFP